MTRRRRYLDVEYAEKIDTFLATRSDVDRETAVEIYLQQCENFETFLRKGTPREVVQRLAFEQMKHAINRR